ncbi:hypothetical protein [Cobetia amphilecti]|uniref:hypothetical protein n=1 Tax=Cobetia amphilecti TaxID=1055104 RepID=UPI00254B0C77|nr:hypothetical protein [Cobetia amphilecti]
MVSENNHYSRNAKFVSVLFVLYYYLDLSVIGDVIRLGPLSYSIGNVDGLSVVSFFSLVYFAFRFYVSSDADLLSRYLSYVGLACSKYTRTSPVLNSLSKSNCRRHVKRQDVSNYKIRLSEILRDESYIDNFEFGELTIYGGGYDRNRGSKGLYIDYEIEPKLDDLTRIQSYRARAKVNFFSSALLYFSAFILFFLKDDSFWDVLLTYVLLVIAFSLLIWNDFLFPVIISF